MEPDYLTVQEAIQHTETSETTIRRWIRMVRSQYSVSLDDTNEQLEAKTPYLRKQNIRSDKFGEQLFEWLLYKPALQEFLEKLDGAKDFPGVDHGRDPSQDHTYTKQDDRRDDDHSDDDHEQQGSREDSQPMGDPGQRSNDPGRDDIHNQSTVNIPQEAFRGLLAELDEKNKQIDRLHTAPRRRIRYLPLPTTPLAARSPP